MLGDGDHPDALAPEHGLECDGVFPLAGEPGEFPDEYFLERGFGLACIIQHFSELGPIGDPSALGLIHVLPHDEVSVLVGVVPERPQLGCDGQVDILAVAGDSGVERRRRVVFSYLCIHCFVLLLAFSRSASRSFSLSYRTVLSHSRSSM